MTEGERKTRIRLLRELRDALDGSSRMLIDGQSRIVLPETAERDLPLILLELDAMIREIRS